MGMRGCSQQNPLPQYWILQKGTQWSSLVPILNRLPDCEKSGNVAIQFISAMTHMTMVKIWETIRLGTEVVVPIIPILKPNSDPSIIQWIFKYQRLMLLFGFQKGKFNRFVTSWRSWFGVHWVKTSAGAAGAMLSLGFSAPWRRTRDGNIAELRRSPWIWGFDGKTYRVLGNSHTLW